MTKTWQKYDKFKKTHIDLFKNLCIITRQKGKNDIILIIFVIKTDIKLICDEYEERISNKTNKRRFYR